MSFGIWEMSNFERILRKDDTDEENHRQNLFTAEPKDKEIIENEKIVANTSGVKNATEGIAYRMISESINVYNTTGGNIPKEKFSKKERKVFENTNGGVWKSKKDSPGNPDFICFREDAESFEMFFIEVKSEYSKLQEDQAKWINLNKWAKTYILRVRKSEELTEKNFVAPSQLRDFSKTKDVGPKELL